MQGELSRVIASNSAAEDDKTVFNLDPDLSQPSVVHRLERAVNDPSQLSIAIRWRLEAL